MIEKAATRVRKKMKFGIPIPVTYHGDEAVELDRINGNTYWKDVTKEEIKNVKIDFKFLENRSKLTILFKKITCNLIFDVNFDITRKYKYVVGGHITKVPASKSYSSVVSRDSVRIMFFITSLNDFDIDINDIGYA